MKYLLLSWLWCYFEPLQNWLHRYASLQKMPSWLYELLSCWKCTSFWLTLLFTFDIYLAILNSIIAWLLSSLTSR